MMSTRWHVILVVTLALGAGLLASISTTSRLAVAQSSGASITTNKSTYQIGDSITICYTVPGPGPITITDSLSGVLKSGADDGTGGCFPGTITPPAGQECERLSYQGSRGSGSTQTCFQVVSSQNANNSSNLPPRYPGGNGSSSAPAFVSITTNKSQYQVGETAQVCYRVSGPGQVVVTDTHGGATKTVVSGHDDGTGGCINGVVTSPSGTVTESISFSADNGGVASAQTTFTVNGASSSGGNGSGSNGGNSSPNTGTVTLNLQPGCNQVTSTFPNGTIGANIAAAIQPNSAVYGIRVQGSGAGKSIFFSDPNAPTDALTANYQDSLVIQVSQAATLTEPPAQFNVSVSAVPCVVVFYGSVQTSSGSTVSGASITASVGTTACGNGSSDNLGNYAVTVTCVGNAGSTVTFQVNGVVANNSGTIPTNPGGAAVHLDLTVPSSKSVGSSPAPSSCPPNQYRAEYYDGTSLSGTPVSVTCETAPLNHNWGDTNPGPGLTKHGFSARWTGQFSFDAGTYTLSAQTDDGMRVWIDGNLVIDKWFLQAPTTYTATSPLSAGVHTVKVEYYDGECCQSVAQLNWTQSTGSSSWPDQGRYQIPANPSANSPYTATFDNKSYDPTTGNFTVDMTFAPNTNIPYILRSTSTSVSTDWMQDAGDILYFPNYPSQTIGGITVPPGGTLTFEASKLGYDTTSSSEAGMMMVVFLILKLDGIDAPQGGAWDNAVTFARAADNIPVVGELTPFIELADDAKTGNGLDVAQILAGNKQVQAAAASMMTKLGFRETQGAVQQAVSLLELGKNLFDVGEALGGYLINPNDQTVTFQNLTQPQ